MQIWRPFVEHQVRLFEAAFCQMPPVSSRPRPCRLLVMLNEEIDRRFKAQQQNLSAIRRDGDDNAMALWPSKQRNDGQNPPPLPHAKARSSCNSLHGTLI